MPRSNLLTIRRGSGTPTASAFEVGEPAFDPSAGKLFIKGSSGMIEIGAGSGGGLASYATPASFPATGASGVLYLASDESRLYRWESSVYVEIATIGGVPDGVDGGTFGA